jgi:membrane associated rhomboid family serine protease/Zn-finger nucleic acid-binding protein
MIEIDGCVECRIAWFDQGEIKNLRTTFGDDGSPMPSSMTPQERHAWRLKHLREDALAEENRTDAAIIGMVLGIPVPEPVPGRKRPLYATWGVAFATAVASIGGFAYGVLSSALRFGLIPANLRGGRTGTILTHFFVHADPFHLLGNLAYFVIFGTRVEALIGPARMLAILVLATIAGGLLHAAGAPDPTIPLIGASGGISGILAAYVFLRPKSTIRMVFSYRVVRIPAAGFFAFWIVMQLIGTAAQISNASAVSALGHIGGAAVGVVLGFAWRAEAAKVDAEAPTRA